MVNLAYVFVVFLSVSHFLFFDIMLLKIIVTTSGADGRCEEIDICHESNPCQNNSTCSMDSPGVTSCQCLAGYTGSHCQHNIDDCDSEPCDHGKCRDLVNDFSCDCDPGYNGKCQGFH